MTLSSVCFSRMYCSRERNQNAGGETLFMLVNAVLYEYGPRFCLYEYGPSKWLKSNLKVFLTNLKISGPVAHAGFWKGGGQKIQKI